MRYAVLRDGIVVNLIEWCGVAPYDPGEGLELVSTHGDFVDIGYYYDGHNFSKQEDE